MKRFMIAMSVAVVLVASNTAYAAVTTLQFDANDLFNYATSDDTRLNQQGTARRISNAPTGRYYESYSDGSRDAGATATQDLQSIASILGWSETSAGYQGMSHVQLWLNAGKGANWGELVVMKPYSSISNSVNGEYDWTANIGENPWDDSPEHNGTYEPGVDEYGLAHYNTNLGGEGHQNAISPVFNPATELWTVTGDFYVDVNTNGIYDAGDADLVLGQDYTIWASGAFNNWRCDDAYENDNWGSFSVEGTIIASAVPEPGAIALLTIAGLTALAAAWVRRRKA